jgi:hypothetical protein
MDYSKINRINLDGEGNIVLTDINDSNITVNYNNTDEFNHLLTQANETILSKIRDILAQNENVNRNFEDILKKYLDQPSDIKQKKNEIAQKVVELKQLVCLLQPSDMKEYVIQTGEDAFNDLNFTELIESIENGTCVLFIGPEISVDSKGNSIHEEYYKSLSDSSLFYDAKEGLFQPGDIYKLLNNAPKFYETQFAEFNQKGNSILQKLAQIPFSIIVAYCPDDTICRILSKYDIAYQFLVYNGTELSTDHIDWNNPVIYNALGCFAQKKGKYILTHQQLNSYIEAAQKIKIPYSLENRIQESTHYIFIGFDFNRWYYRLLLFLFKFNDSSKRFAFEEVNKTEIINRDFIHKQFGIDFENSQYDEFAKVLLKKSSEAGLSRSLDSEFAQRMLKELETIRVKSFDSQKLEELIRLSEATDLIGNKITSNK